jgi:hypothetical protein
MNFWLGVGYIAVGIGLAVIAFGMALDMAFGIEWGVALGGLGLALVVAPILVGFLWVGIYLITGGTIGPTPQVGSCYRAVAKNSVMPISTGKTIILIPYTHADLMEIPCP